MGANHDAVSNPTLPFTADTSWTHTPAGTPKGVVVVIAQGNSSQADQVAGVTYGGVAMSRIQFTGDGGGSEAGASYLYFLGSGIPTGSQTVAIDLTSPSQNFAAWCYTVTTDGGRDAEVAASGVFSSGTASNPDVTLDPPDDFDGVMHTVIFSGQSTPDIAIAAPWTNTTVIEPGAYGLRAAHRAFAGASLTVTWSMGGDDSAVCAVAVDEVDAPFQQQAIVIV